MPEDREVLDGGRAGQVAGPILEKQAEVRAAWGACAEILAGENCSRCLGIGILPEYLPFARHHGHEALRHFHAAEGHGHPRVRPDPVALQPDAAAALLLGEVGVATLGAGDEAVPRELLERKDILQVADPAVGVVREVVAALGVRAALLALRGVGGGPGARVLAPRGGHVHGLVGHAVLEAAPRAFVGPAAAQRQGRSDQRE
mmetsp:Transcript_23434/g.67566  ORF Transcript_23434/g.67566 Transcript_23434/m.67566 type:complete len:202 (+) Transcript_23434:789-1394(+)